MGGEEPPLETQESTIEEDIAAAQNTEDLQRVSAEVNHTHQEKMINSKRWGELSQLIHDRSMEIATGGKKK